MTFDSLFQQGLVLLGSTLGAGAGSLLGSTLGGGTVLGSLLG